MAQLSLWEFHLHSSSQSSSLLDPKLSYAKLNQSETMLYSL